MKINNKNLLKLSLAISISGIFMLLLLTNIIKPREITTQSEIRLNELVKISGKVVEEKNYDDFSVLTLQDSLGEIIVTYNHKGFENEIIEVTGKVTEYRNNFQIQAEKIKII